MNGYMQDPSEMTDEELAGWVASFNAQPPTMDYMAEFCWAMRVMGEADSRKRTFPSEIFTYSNGTLVAEASTLGLAATPEVIYVRSAKTGNVVAFRFHRSVIDSAGEIVADEFCAEAPVGCTVHVLND